MKKILLIISLTGGIALSAQSSGSGAKTKTETSGTVVKTQSNDTTDKVVDFIDVMPEYPGGSSAMYTYIAQNIKYPKDGIDSAKGGTVYVEFVVRRDGYVSNVRVARGVKDYPSFGAEAVRVVYGMPKWKPAMLNNKPVSYRMMIPIKFTLD